MKDKLLKLIIGIFLSVVFGQMIGISSLADDKVLDGGVGLLGISDGAGAGAGAPTDATYITQTSDATLSAEQAMGGLATGIVKNTTTTGVQSIAVAGTDYSLPVGWTDNNPNVVLTDINDNLGVGTGTVGTTNQLHIVLDASKDILIDGTTNPRAIDTGVMRFEHTPAIANTRCITKNIDVNSKSSTHGDVINLTATGLAAGETATAYQVNMDSSTSTGGVMRGLSISKSGAGSAVGHAIHVDSGMDVLSHFAGTFINVEQAWDENGGFVDVTAAFNATGTDVTLFDADDDKVHIGMAATFNQIRANLDTFAGVPGIMPTFAYSSGGGTPVWTDFPLVDETQGLRQNGLITWFVADLTSPTWAVATINGVSKFYIRITRTQASILADPIEDTIQVASTTDYEWDEIGNLTINTIILEGTSDEFEQTITTVDPTGDHTFTIPDDDLASNDLMVGSGAGTFVYTAKSTINLSDFNDDLTHTSLSLARISGSTFSTVQHLQDIFHSAGWVSGGGITDDADGTITIAAGTGLIRATDNATAEIVFMDWSAESGANVNLADSDINYVYVEYNAGSPQVVATTTERTDFNKNVLLAVIQRSGTTLHINNPQKHVVGDHANSMIRRLKETMKFGRVSGAVISATGTRNWAITTGDFWEGLGEFTLAAFDSSGVDSFSYWYRQVSDSGWNEVVTQSPIHQTNYDDNSGSLATLSNNKYGVHWCYIETDDHAHVVYGQGDYTLAQAEDASPPAGVPEPIEANGILIGKIIIKESAASFTQIESAFGTSFTPSVAVDHGSLVGLSDDDHAQYALDAGDIYTGVHDFGGADSFEVVNSATPTTDATGEVALDTTITDHQPLVQYYDGAENMTVIAIDTAELPATDNEIIKYDAASDKFVLEADSGGIASGWVDDGGVVRLDDAADDVGVGTSTPSVRLEVWDDSGIEGEIRIHGGDHNAATDYVQISHRVFNQVNLGESVFIGKGAGEVDNLTTNRNVFVGYEAGLVAVNSPENTFVGYQAGDDLTGGSQNTFIGSKSGTDCLTSVYNTFVGKGSGENATGNYNTYVGGDAGLFTGASANNTFMGYEAGRGASTGSNNTFIGHQAGRSISTAGDNTFIGHLAGRYLANGSTANTVSLECSYLGMKTKASADGTTNETVIGYDAIGKGSNTVILGAEGANTTVYATGALIVNEEGFDVDSRIEGLSDINLFYVNAGDDKIGIGTTAPGSLLSLGLAGTTLGDLSMAGNTSGVVTIQPAAAAGTYILTLPTTDGNISEFLQTDGSGVLSWGATSKSNMLINGGFEVVQRGTSFTSTTTPANSDDTYLPDRWILLSDGNDIVDVTQQSGGGVSGNEDYLRMDVETTAKKFGILQIIENKNTKSIVGGTASMSFEARVSDVTKLTDIRAVVVSWDSTADIVTSDIVSSWNIEGTRPTLATNWTEENTDSDLNVTASWAKYTTAGISIDTASTTNVGVFIYQNDVATNDTAGTLLEITNVELVEGAIASNYEYRDIIAENAKCIWYYEEYNNEGLASYLFGVGNVLSATTARVLVSYNEKRVAPTITMSTAGDFQIVNNTGSVEDVTVLTFANPSTKTALANVTVAANLTAVDATRLFDDGGANARIFISSEL